MGGIVFGVNTYDVWGVKTAGEHSAVLMPGFRFFRDSFLQQQSNLES